MTHTVSAEIVGSVLSVDTAVGASVSPDDAVILLESMKMEIPVLAGVAGTVAEVVVAPGDVVHEGDPLVMIDEG